MNKVWGLVFRLSMYVQLFVSDIYRLVLSVGIALAIYMCYTMLPFNFLSLVASVAIIYKVGSYKIVLYEHNKQV